MATSERLELGLLVGRDHVVVCAECLAVEDPLVEVENARAFAAKSGSRVEDPRAITPWLDRRRRQPAAHRRRRDRLDEPFAPRLGRQLVRAPPRQRNVTSLGWLAGQRLDPGHHRGAETPRPSRARAVLQSRKSLFTKALAPLRRHVDTHPDALGRCPRSAHHRPPPPRCELALPRRARPFRDDARSSSTARSAGESRTWKGERRDIGKPTSSPHPMTGGPAPKLHRRIYRQRH